MHCHASPDEATMKTPPPETLEQDEELQPDPSDIEVTLTNLRVTIDVGKVVITAERPTQPHARCRCDK